MWLYTGFSPFFYRLLCVRELQLVVIMYGTPIIKDLVLWWSYGSETPLNSKTREFPMTVQVKDSKQQKPFWHFIYQGRLVSVKAASKVEAVREFRRIVFGWAFIIWDVHSIESINWLNGRLNALGRVNLILIEWRESSSLLFGIMFRDVLIELSENGCKAHEHLINAGDSTVSCVLFYALA